MAGGLQAGTTDLLRALADAVTAPASIEKLNPLAGFLSGKIPKRPAHWGDGRAALYLTGREALLYRNCLDKMAEDAALRALTRGDIDKDLWKWVCQLYVGHIEGTGAAPASEESLREYWKSATQPVKDFDVVLQLDNVSLKMDDQQELGGLRLYVWTPAAAASFGVATQGWPAQVSAELLGKTVCSLRVAAVTPAAALRDAQRDCVRRLDLIRAALAPWRDKLWLQWVPGDAYLMLEAGSMNVVGGISRQRTALPFDMTKEQLDEAQQVLAPFQPLTDGSMNDRTSKACWLAVRSISSSLQRSTADDQVLDLCTALEAVLTTKAEGRKGEWLAIRAMALAHRHGVSVAPVDILDVYVKRSSITHGSDRDIATEAEAKSLLSVAWRVLFWAIAELKAAKGMKLAELHGMLSDRDALGRAREAANLESSVSRDLQKFVDDQIRKPG